MMRHRAFTMIEILIAFFILATSMHVLLKLQLTSLLRIADHKQAFYHTLLARERLNHVFYQDAAVFKNKKERLDDDTTIIKTEYAALENNSSFNQYKDIVQKATVEIVWQDGANKQQVSITTYARK